MGMSKAKAVIEEAALEGALVAAQKLPPPARRVLAERLLQQLTAPPNTVIVPLQQFDGATQQRFQELMDRSNEGRLTPAARKELEVLVKQYEEMLLANSEALVRVSHPELFDETGRLVKSRLNQAIRRKVKEKRESVKSRREPTKNQQGQ